MELAKKKIDVKNKFKNFIAAITGMYLSIASTVMVASAGESAGGFPKVDVTISDDAEANAGDLMNNIIGILLSITRYVGVALVIYGIYEVVMSFMQNQPEAKTKGIIMALAGVAMIALKSILEVAGVLGGTGG